MKTLITTLVLIAAGSAFAAEIELSIEPVTNLLLVTGCSQGVVTPPHGVDITGVFPHPDTGWPCSVSGNNIVHLPESPSQEALAWASNNAFRVDFFACIKNTSNKMLNFYEEWNSDGFDRLKIVCYGWHEIWISKQAGLWYRNFPSWTSLQPGDVFRIPVAFDEALWDGVNRAQMPSQRVVSICVFYDQRMTPTNSFGITSNHWQGCQFSRGYDIGDILPRRGFTCRKRTETDVSSNKVTTVIADSIPKSK